MAIAISLAILIFGPIAAFRLTKGNSDKRKYIVWGITAMVAIAPFLSFLIGITYGSIVGSGWAAGGTMVILFSIIFLVGLIIMLIGIFKKSEHGTTETK